MWLRPAIEIDISVLDRLRERHPGKADRKLIEDLARIALGFAALGEVRSAGSAEVERALQSSYFARRVSEERRRSILELFQALTSMVEDAVDPRAILEVLAMATPWNSLAWRAEEIVTVTRLCLTIQI
jgi:hypothetical protein